MAEYQQLVVDQFIEQNRERRLNPRKTNDLPVEIIGKGAFWRNPGPLPQGNARPSSYHVTVDDIDYPICYKLTPLVLFRTADWDCRLNYYTRVMTHRTALCTAPPCAICLAPYHLPRPVLFASPRVIRLRP